MRSLVTYRPYRPTLANFDRWFDSVFQEHVPGAAGQPHRVFPEGPHFIQEVEAEALADSIVAAASAS